MRKYLAFILFTFILTSCHNKVEVPPIATIDDICTILEAKKIDIDELKAYLPAFVKQYTTDVENFLAHPSKDEAERLERRNKSLENALSTLEGMESLVDKNFQFDLVRYTKNLQRSKEDADTLIKKLLSGE